MTLEEELRRRLHGRVVIAGIGNRARGDDAAGSWLAGRLAGTVGAVVIDTEEVPESFIGEIAAAQPDVVVLVDAVEMAAAPGAVAILEAEQLARYWPSTHRVPLALVIEVLERRVDAEVLVLAIQPGQVGLGAPLAAAVAGSLESLAALLRDLLPRRQEAAGSRPRGSARRRKEPARVAVLEGATSW